MKKKGCFLLLIITIIIAAIGVLADLTGLNITSVDKLKKGGKVILGIEDFTPMFGAAYQNDTLRILITRFEDYGLNSEDADKTACFGRAMEAAIGTISLEKHLPLIVKFLPGECAINHMKAIEIGDKHHADVVVWGKLKNMHAGCESDGISINLEPTQYFINHEDRFIQRIDTNLIRADISAYDIDNRFSVLGEKTFYYWLRYYLNQKIGFKDPSEYIVPTDMPVVFKEEWLMERAQLYADNNLDSLAKVDYKNILTLNPQNNVALRLMLELNIKNSNEQEAILNAEKMVRNAPKASNAYYHLAYAQYYFDRDSLSMDNIDKAIKLDSSDYYNFNLKGNLLNKQKKYGDAIVYYSKAINLKKDGDRLYANRAYAFKYIDSCQAVIEDLNTAISINDKDDDYFHERAKCFYELDSANLALKDINRALKINEKNPYFHLLKGRLYADRDSFESGISYFSKAISLKSNDPNFFYFRGQAFLDLKNYEKASNDFGTAIQLDSSSGSSYNQRGLCKMKLGQPAEALSDFEKVLQLGGVDTASVFNNISYAKTDLGQCQEGLEWIVKSLDSDEVSVNQYKNKGRALVGLKRYGEAITAFDKAIENDKSNTYFYSLRAHAKFKSWNLLGAYFDFLRSKGFWGKTFWIIISMISMGILALVICKKCRRKTVLWWQQFAEKT